MKAKGSTSRWREYKPLSHTHWMESRDWDAREHLSWFLKRLFQMIWVWFGACTPLWIPVQRGDPESLTPDVKIGSHEGKPADAHGSAQGQIYWAILKSIGLGLTFLWLGSMQSLCLSGCEIRELDRAPHVPPTALDAKQDVFSGLVIKLVQIDETALVKLVIIVLPERQDFLLDLK